MNCALFQGINTQLGLPTSISNHQNTSNTLTIPAIYQKIGRLKGDCLQQKQNCF